MNLKPVSKRRERFLDGFQLLGVPLSLGHYLHSFTAFLLLAVAIFTCRGRSGGFLSRGPLSVREKSPTPSLDTSHRVFSHALSPILYLFPFPRQFPVFVSRL